MSGADRKPVLRVVAGALAAPVLLPSATIAVLLSWWDELPDPIASHWGASGEPNGFTSPSGVLTWMTGFGIAVAAAALGGALARSASVVRSLAPLIAGIGAFLQVFLLATVAPQRGVPDAGAVPLPGWAFGWGVSAGAAGGLITLALLPRWTSTPPAGLMPAQPREPGGDDGEVWTRVVVIAAPAVVVATSVTLLMVVLALATDAWWMVLVAALLVLTIGAMFAVGVVVDGSGLRVGGPLGWPRVRIGIDDITAVATAEVHALRAFGGWGYRMAFAGPMAGAKGFVLRSGTAIAVTRRSGAVEVVVVDDAATGAALLEAHRRRAAVI